MFYTLLTLSLLPLLALSAPSLQFPSALQAANSDIRPLVMTYYVDWAPRSNIDFSQFDYIDFAFALPDERFALTWDVPNAAQLLRDLVTDAHTSGSTKVKLSIGGWTGSR